MYIKYTDKPKSKYPLSKGMADSELNMGKRTLKDLIKDPSHMFGWFLRRAFTNPGVLQMRYHEEPSNSREYEDRVLYNLTTNTITTNLNCPISYYHHVGQTCYMCEQKG